MSVEKARAFVAKLNSDKELAKKVTDAKEAYTGDKSNDDAAIKEILLPIAAQACYDFTVEDYKATFDEEGEASADELDAVAGGTSFCIFSGKGPGGSGGFCIFSGK